MEPPISFIFQIKRNFIGSVSRSWNVDSVATSNKFARKPSHMATKLLLKDTRHDSEAYGCTYRSPNLDLNALEGMNATDEALISKIYIVQSLKTLCAEGAFQASFLPL